MNAWEEKLLDRQDGYEEGLAEGEERGIRVGEERGELKKAEKIATKMKAKGISAEEISDMTGLSMSIIEKL